MRSFVNKKGVRLYLVKFESRRARQTKRDLSKEFYFNIWFVRTNGVWYNTNFVDFFCVKNNCSVYTRTSEWGLARSLTGSSENWLFDPSTHLGSGRHKNEDGNASHHNTQAIIHTVAFSYRKNYHLRKQAIMSTRHAGYDNCKNVFIFYVVFIHLCNSNLIKWKNGDEHWSSLWMDLFESYTLWNEKLSVPGFVFMSGFLGKGFLPNTEPTGRKTDRRWEKTLSVLLFGSGLVQLTYLILGLVLEQIFIGTVTWSVSFPLWEKLDTWYLIALFLWRLSTPLIGRLKWPITASFVVTFICLHAQFEGPKDMRYVFGVEAVF